MIYNYQFLNKYSKTFREIRALRAESEIRLLVNPRKCNSSAFLLEEAQKDYLFQKKIISLKLRNLMDIAIYYPFYILLLKTASFEQKLNKHFYFKSIKTNKIKKRLKKLSKKSLAHRENFSIEPKKPRQSFEHIRKERFEIEKQEKAKHRSSNKMKQKKLAAESSENLKNNQIILGQLLNPQQVSPSSFKMQKKNKDISLKNNNLIYLRNIENNFTDYFFVYLRKRACTSKCQFDTWIANENKLSAKIIKNFSKEKINSGKKLKNIKYEQLSVLSRKRNVYSILFFDLITFKNLRWEKMLSFLQKLNEEILLKDTKQIAKKFKEPKRPIYKIEKAEDFSNKLRKIDRKALRAEASPNQMTLRSSLLSSEFQEKSIQRIGLEGYSLPLLNDYLQTRFYLSIKDDKEEKEYDKQILNTLYDNIYFTNIKSLAKIKVFLGDLL